MMKNLLEIEAAIKQLSTAEARQLADWLDRYLDDDWERQMENDLATGKLDNFIAKVELDIEADRVKSLDEVIDNT